MMQKVKSQNMKSHTVPLMGNQDKVLAVKGTLSVRKVHVGSIMVPSWVWGVGYPTGCRNSR